MDRHSFGENVGASRRGLLAVAVAAAMTAGVAPRVVLAQEQAGQSQLEEIVVTATKAAAGADVSKVPISITAFDGNMIDSLNAKDFEDLAVRTPGVVLTETVFGGLAITNIQIRGISSRTSEPTTGMYLDDVPFTTIGNNTNIGGSVALPVVFDLNRVEVLRGPQGTLFGSTSEGGAVRLIPNAPSLKSYSQYARTEYGSTEDGGDDLRGRLCDRRPDHRRQARFSSERVVPRRGRLDRPLSARREGTRLPLRHRAGREYAKNLGRARRAHVEAQRPPFRRAVDQLPGPQGCRPDGLRDHGFRS